MSQERQTLLEGPLWVGIQHPLVVFDREGVIEEVNPAFTNMFSENGGGLHGTHLSDTLFANDRVKFAEWLSAILHPGESGHPPIELEHQGRYFRADIFSVSIPGGDSSPPPLAMILIDITREKQIEQKKADFTSMIVHDLRGPLTAIMGSMELVVSSWGSNLKDSYRDLLTSGISESGRMMDLINELLDISKIESGKFTIVTDRISLTTVIHQAMQSMHNIAAREGIYLDSVMDRQLPNVEGDRDKLTQVMINLLSNAIKFTPPKGLVTIFAEPVILTPGTGKEDHILITVTDTGQGISKEEIPRLFTRYSQADNQKAAEGKKMGGTGLGLYIVKELVEAHGGRIQLVSEKGLGTSVVFTIPIPAE